ncbi:MAG: carboxypeptidase-like regulatory domain-containing protein [Halobacteriaceae archaeon]
MHQRALAGTLLAALVLAGLAGAGTAATAGAAGAGEATAAANGTITGTVVWANGTPADGATVRAVGQAGDGTDIAGEAFVTRTDSRGRYELSVPAGGYTVVVFADGETSEPRAVGVEAGTQATLEAVLRDRNAPPPDGANVSASVRKNVTGVAAGDTARLSFSSAEENAVGVRRLSVTFRTAVNETWVEVAALDGGPVTPPEGRTIRFLHFGARDPSPISDVRFLLRVEQAAIGDGTLAVYEYRGGRWESASTSPVVSTEEALLLRVDLSGPGYVAVVSETTTTTATPWISTGTPADRQRLTGSGLRTGLGLLALVAAVALAVRGIRE